MTFKIFSQKPITIIISLLILVITIISWYYLYISLYKINYLKANSCVVNMESNSISGLELIDTDKYKVFLAGEQHGTKVNYDLYFNFIKYFHEKVGINYIIDEDGYGASLYVDQYIHTGNKEILDDYMKNLIGTYSGSNERYQFYEKLYGYNMALPESERIHIRGVDIEHQYKTALKYLSTLIKNKTIPKEIKTSIDSINYILCHIENPDYPKLLEQTQFIQKDIAIQKSTYENLFGEDFFDFEFILNNLSNIFKANIIYKNGDYIAWGNFREKAMVDNFIKIYNHLDKEKIFGQWGSEHVSGHKFKNNFYNFDGLRLAQYLNDFEPSLHGKICSIRYLYDNCSFPENESYSSKHTETLPTGNVFYKSKKGNLTLYKLNSDTIPFTKKLYYDSVVPKTASEGLTTDYFQYALLILNSPACTVFK